MESVASNEIELIDNTTDKSTIDSDMNAIDAANGDDNNTSLSSPTGESVKPSGNLEKDGRPVANEKSMLFGSSSLSVGPVRFHLKTFVKQILYHGIPWPLGGLLCAYLDGHYAADNQLLGVFPGSTTVTCLWALQRLVDWSVLSSIVLYCMGLSFSPMEFYLLIIMWGSRMLMISVKYSYLDSNELELFHKETKPVTAIRMLQSHLLTMWASPDWESIVREVYISAERASLKGTQDWYTRKSGLGLKLEFLGHNRCNHVLDLLDNGDAAAYSCKHVKSKFGCVEGLPENYTHQVGYTNKNIHKLKVPIGTLLSAIIYQQVKKESKDGFLAVVKHTNRLFCMLTIVTPLFVRLWVPALPSEALLSKLNMSASSVETQLLNTQCSAEIGTSHALCSNFSIIGYVLFLFVCGFNGSTMFHFLFVSVADYHRRYAALESIRKLLRPTAENTVGEDLQDGKMQGASSQMHDEGLESKMQEPTKQDHNAPPNRTDSTEIKRERSHSDITGVQFHFFKSPPLVDVRIQENLFGILAMKDVVLQFGKEYLLRTQFVLSYAIVCVVILLIMALYDLFFKSELSSAAILSATKFFPKEYALRYFSESNCLAIGMTISLCLIILVALTFADFANDEPLYFRQALTSQGLGVQSDLISFANNDFRQLGQEGGSEGNLTDNRSKFEILNRKAIESKLRYVSQAIIHAERMIDAMDILYPIKILGMRADWGHMSGIVAILASAFAAIWRATSQ